MLKGSRGRSLNLDFLTLATEAALSGRHGLDSLFLPRVRTSLTVCSRDLAVTQRQLVLTTHASVCTENNSSHLDQMETLPSLTNGGRQTWEGGQIFLSH